MGVFADADKIRLRACERSTHPPCCNNERAGKACGLVIARSPSQPNVSTSCETCVRITQRIETDTSDSQCCGDSFVATLYDRLRNDRNPTACVITWLRRRY